MIHQFKFNGAPIFDCRVPTLQIVKCIDVFAYRCLCLGAAGEVVNVVDLALKRGKETLGDGIIPTITFAAHTTVQRVGIEDLAVVVAGVGTTTIRVVHEAGAWVTLLQCRPQGG